VLQEFKTFVSKGNLVQIAVAFVMGVAFASVVSSFTEHVVNPLLGYVFNASGLDGIGVFGKTVDGVQQGSVGAFAAAIINFLVVAVVMFFVVKAYNRFEASEEAAPAGQTEIELLTQIRDELARR
jgi:large conductance mechanosensitive channel